MENEPKLKILLLSNATFVPSGYGVQAKGMLRDWIKHYDARLLANYGVEGARIGLNDVQIYPCLAGDDTGSRTAQLIFRKWRPDLFITLYDIWMGAYVQEANTPSGLQPIHPHWVPIVMVDHLPIPESTLINAKEAYKIVVPTHYAEEQFTRRGIESTYIPFGIDTDVFKPSEDKKADKIWLDKHSVPLSLSQPAKIDEDSFVIVINGANKDPYRKAFMRMFIALQLFLENNPDAKKDTRVYVHSWMKQARDIPHGAQTLRIIEYCKGPDDYDMLCGVPDYGMARIYGSADVYFHLSQGGGFEIPLLEAMSCGVPVIASDFISMSELAKDHGWLIPEIREGKAKSLYFSALDALQFIANEEKAADALEDAYTHPEKRRSFGEEGRRFALDFDWNLVNPMWHRLFDEICEEWRQKPIAERLLAA